MTYPGCSLYISFLVEYVLVKLQRTLGSLSYISERVLFSFFSRFVFSSRANGSPSSPDICDRYGSG